MKIIVTSSTVLLAGTNSRIRCYSPYCKEIKVQLLVQLSQKQIVHISVFPHKILIQNNYFEEILMCLSVILIMLSSQHWVLGGGQITFNIIVEIRYHWSLFFSFVLITGFCLQKCPSFSGHRGGWFFSPLVEFKSHFMYKYSFIGNKVRLAVLHLAELQNSAYW